MNFKVAFFVTKCIYEWSSFLCY